MHARAHADTDARSSHQQRLRFQQPHPSPLTNRSLTSQSMNAHEGAALLVFGSYSCPMWREKAPIIMGLAEQYK